MKRAFEPFARIVRKLPTEAILNLLDRQRAMIEEDFEKGRMPLSDDGESIISFHRFVSRVKGGEAMACAVPLPQEHVAFYRETIGRLIQIHALPAGATELFDRAFTPAA